MLFAQGFLIFSILSSFSYCLHLIGKENSTFIDPIQGPGSRLVQVLFEKSFENGQIPYVLISQSKIHQINKKTNDYSLAVKNVTNTGFFIFFQTNTTLVAIGMQIEWMAFDENSDFFGEVIYYEEYNTEDLNTFKFSGDEHRVQIKTIPFARTYTQPPEIAIFVLGAANDGIERLLSANHTNVSLTSFDLIALAWHHTDLSYYKFAIVVKIFPCTSKFIQFAQTLYPNNCLTKTGRDYVWDEYSHTFYSHPWNELEDNDDKFRFKPYSIQLKHNTSNNFRPDFIYTGFVGYDIKNYQPNQAQFNLAIENIGISEDRKSIHMDVGTWQRTQVAGAQWNYIVCETNGIFQSHLQLPLSIKILIFIGLLAIGAVISQIIKKKQIQPLKDKKEKKD